MGDQVHKPARMQQCGVNRQRLESLRQQRQQPEMTVKGEEQQRHQQVEKTRDHRTVASPGVKEGGERQPHLHTDDLTGHAHGGKQQLQRQPHRRTDNHLFGQHPDPFPGVKSHLRFRQRAAEQDRRQQRQARAQPGVNRLLAKHRCNVQQRGNAHHNEKIVTDQPVELVERKSEGHQPIT